MTGLTRDHIIDRAAQAIVAAGFDRSVLPIENTDKWAAAAADAVLRLLADDLRARSRDRAPFGVSEPRAESAAQFALGAYSHRLRALRLPEGDQP